MSLVYESFPVIGGSSGCRDGWEIKYKVYNGVAYHIETPDDLVVLLNRIIILNTRVKVLYGDKRTGEIWQTPESGKIGTSTGNIKVPIILRNKRSTGGSPMLDDCIMEIIETNGKRVLYSVSK